MKKIAIFGKPGSGKSTLSKSIASAKGLQLYALDSIVYKSDGSLVDSQIYTSEHEKILSSKHWIIDGFGPIDSFYKRLEAADTLIYIDLPYWVSYYWVTKRLLKGFFSTPEGWPEGSSVIKGTIQSFKVLKLCPKFWNDAFLQKLNAIAANKSVFIIRDLSELNNFVERHININ